MSVYIITYKTSLLIFEQEITLADLFHLPMGALSFERIGFKGVYEYPNVKRWWEEITSIPVWKEIWVEATVAFEEFSKKRSAKS